MKIQQTPPSDIKNSLRADVGKYRPEAHKSEKLKNPPKIHRVPMVELLSEIYIYFILIRWLLLLTQENNIGLGASWPGFLRQNSELKKIVFKIKTT